MQEAGLDVRGDIKVRDTALASRTYTDGQDIFTRDRSSEHMWSNKVQHKNSDLGVNLGPATF